MLRFLQKNVIPGLQDSNAIFSMVEFFRILYLGYIILVLVLFSPGGLKVEDNTWERVQKFWNLVSSEDENMKFEM